MIKINKKIAIAILAVVLQGHGIAIIDEIKNQMDVDVVSIVVKERPHDEYLHIPPEEKKDYPRIQNGLKG